MKLVSVLLGVLLLTACSISEEPEEPKVGLNKFPSVYDEDGIFNAKIVVSDTGPEEEYINGQDFLAWLMEDFEMKPDTLIEYDQIVGLYHENAIFVGSCHTNPPNKFVNLFADCLSLEKDAATIRLVEKDNVTLIQVVGYSSEDTREALKILRNAEQHNLSAREVVLVGNEPDIEIRKTSF